MLFSSRLLQPWFFSVFLLCSPVPHDGRPIDALSSRTKRSVTHTQLMHDKSRTLQDFRRRLWLQELLGVLHTAETHNQQTGGGGGGSSGVGLPGVQPSTAGTALHSKPPGGTKNLPVSSQPEEDEDPNLPQETNKSQTYEGPLKGPGRKKKKGRSGRRRDGEKRKRRARSLRWILVDQDGTGLHLEWRSLLGLRRAL
ncbi:parathyroid hormone-like hormone a [Kryptolebias marmoratus]|uniref:Parathyroid hormone-like hormone a n=1 Tax=Kryptolebias marmoratus TaxID=37003 RepID=A0A3Q3AGG6_KRYMA|nr:parathyroid hormone-like hormone a [Kryptolebias marmoratus]XP_017297611.1 parathyroid hormone-like hormone a [Kryptolebias marmoratus]XP_024858889.1 parathyroid hormone-like hormone a [Kryptolebias marmoratus]